MTSVTYSQLVTLINNSGLTVGETYKITDYPSFQPELKARTTNELWRDGKAGTYKLLYNPFNVDGEYDWASSYGWVYYLEDNLGNCAWCDWVNTATTLFSGTNSKVKVLPYILNGKYKLPVLTISNCSDMLVDGSNNLTLANCKKMNIGEGNQGTLSSVSNTTIGKNNSNLSLSKITNFTVGDENARVTSLNISNVSIGDRNQDLNITKGSNEIGSDNKKVSINGECNIINNKNIDVTITADLNDVNDSKYVSINSTYNTIEESNSVEIIDSVGNNIDSSRLVRINKVNNNDIWVNSYTFDQEIYNSGNPVPFQRVSNRNQEKVGKIVESKIPKQDYQADNAGLVINTVNAKTKGSSKSNDDYFIGNDKLWNAEGVVTDRFDVTLIISKTDSQRCYVTGSGRYLNGELASIGYSWITPGKEAKFTEEDGTEHTGPFTVLVTENKKYYVSIVEATPVIPVPPNDELWYISSTNNVVSPYSSSFGGRSITSNTYSGNKGIIKFDGDLSQIGDYVFYNCSDLTVVYFPNSVTTIGEHTFDGCHMSNLYLNQITTVGYESFDFNDQTSLNIPATLTSIDRNPFRSEHGNLVITVDSNNTVYTDGGGNNCIYQPSNHKLVSGGVNTVIPSDCTTLGGWAFSECYDLTSIEIPATVTYLDMYAFACDNSGSLQELIVHSNPSIGYDCFMNQATGGVLKYSTGVDPSQWLSHLPSGWTSQAI